MRNCVPDQAPELGVAGATQAQALHQDNVQTFLLPGHSDKENANLLTMTERKLMGSSRSGQPGRVSPGAPPVKLPQLPASGSHETRGTSSREEGEFTITTATSKCNDSS